MSDFKFKKKINEYNIFGLEIHYFMLVYKHGGISGASRQIGQDPANISRMISKLEDTVGASLFARHKTGLHPTKTGQRLYLSIAGARSEFHKNFYTGDKSSQMIRIGFAPTIGFSHFNSNIIDGLFELGLEPDLTIVSSSELIEKMKLRQIDFALVHTNVKFPGLVSRKIASESLALCSCSGQLKDILLLHPDMLGLEKILGSVEYSQRWLIKDYFVLAKLLTTNQRFMGVLPESLLRTFTELKPIHIFKEAGKITALSWPGSIGIKLLRWIEK